MGGTIGLYVKPNGKSIIDLDNTDYLYAKIASNFELHRLLVAYNYYSRISAAKAYNN